MPGVDYLTIPYKVGSKPRDFFTEDHAAIKWQGHKFNSGLSSAEAFLVVWGPAMRFTAPFPRRAAASGYSTLLGGP